jgi:hypothetical protein
MRKVEGVRRVAWNADFVILEWSWRSEPELRNSLRGEIERDDRRTEMVRTHEPVSSLNHLIAVVEDLDSCIFADMYTGP